MYSWLCRVTLEIVAPEICTGSTRATGVMRPVLPTWTSIALTVVAPSGDSNLNAMAHRGWWPVYPSASRAAISSTLTTIPSMS